MCSSEGIRVGFDILDSLPCRLMIQIASRGKNGVDEELKGSRGEIQRSGCCVREGSVDGSGGSAELSRARRSTKCWQETKRARSFSKTLLDLQPTRSLFGGRKRVRTVEDRTQKILRVQESSLDPHFRLFPPFPHSPPRPHSALPHFGDMQEEPTALPMTAISPPQSVAALLPAEIVDCIFSHFDFNYSLDAFTIDRNERTRILSKMSVIAEGWKGPARRRLCRTVWIVRWNQLAEGVPEWARGGPQNARIQYS